MNHPVLPNIANRLSQFDWNDLKYFLAVAREGTIRGGAVALRTNHATVSRRLTALEHATEARLFDRTKTGLMLTQLGEALLPIAERVEEDIASTSRLIAGQDTRPSGTVHISMAPFLAQSSITGDLADFGLEHPEIDIHIGITNNLVSLDRREADISIRYAHKVHDDVYGRKLVDCNKAAYCTPEYAAQMQDNQGEGVHWIGWMEAEGAKSADWIRKSSYPKARLRHRTIDPATQIHLARKSIGLCMLPVFIGDDTPGLIRAPFQELSQDRKIWLLYHGDLRRTARIRLLLDFLQERICARREVFLGEAKST